MYNLHCNVQYTYIMLHMYKPLHYSLYIVQCTWILLYEDTLSKYIPIYVQCVPCHIRLSLSFNAKIHIYVLHKNLAFYTFKFLYQPFTIFQNGSFFLNFSFNHCILELYTIQYDVQRKPVYKYMNNLKPFTQHNMTAKWICLRISKFILILTQIILYFSMTHL